MATAKKPDKVLVIGAGPAGLTLALKLAESGVRVEVLEAEDRVGGLCMSIPFQGCRFDLGGHRFITKDTDVQVFIEQLMGDELLVRPRKSVILLKNKVLRYPVKAQDVLTKLGFGFSVKAFLDYFLTFALQHTFPRPDSSFEEWVINRFGATLYNLYFGPYSAKLWGIEPCRISHKWADQRIQLLNLWDVIARMLWRTADNPKTYADSFYYPRQGIGQIFEVMTERIERLGGTIRLNSPVRRVSLAGSRVSSVTHATPEGADRETSADWVVNTSPLPQFMKMLSPAIAPDAEEAVSFAHYRGIRFMNVVLDTPALTDNTWTYVPEPQYVFFRIQELRNWSPTVVPDGKTALTLEIACNYKDDIWNMPEDALWEACRTSLAALGLVKDPRVCGYFCSYARHAYPIYYIDYPNTVRGLYTFISRISNLRTIGRQGLFRYNNMDHSIKMGLLTAGHIIDGTPGFQDIMSIATEAKIFDWQDPGRE